MLNGMVTYAPRGEGGQLRQREVKVEKSQVLEGGREWHVYGTCLEGDVSL